MNRLQFGANSDILAEQVREEVNNILISGTVFLLVFVAIMSGVIISRKKRDKKIKKLIIISVIIGFVILLVTSYLAHLRYSILYRI